ncbi:MAG: Holliday junction resolvase RuvX [Fimbriimonadales bacterium]
MRLLGVDFGFKRIGLAIAEKEHGIVTPRPNLRATGTLAKDAQRLVEMAKKEEVDLVVIGLPIEESGEEGRMARICRALAGHIADGGVRVQVVDESFTSLEAEVRLRDGGSTAKGLKAAASLARSEGGDAEPPAPTPSASRHEPPGKMRGLKAIQRRRLKDGEAARLILERYLQNDE